MQRRTLFYVVDWLPPDFGAVGQYAVVFATELAQAGRRVCLIGLTTGQPSVSQQSYPGGGSLEVRRLSASGYDKSRNLRRLLWTLRANARLMFAVVRDPASKGGQLLFTGSPPFMLYFAMLAKLTRRMSLRYRITDFHPEVLIAGLGRRPWPLGLLEWMTWALRRRVDAFEVLGEDQRRLLFDGGIPAQRITLKRDPSPVLIDGTEKPLRRPAGLDGYKVLLYSGNYGVAHDLDTVVEGLIRHHREGSGRFALWLSATGAKVDVLSRRLEEGKVPFVRTLPVRLQELPYLLAAADAHLVTLRPQFSGIVLPSKIYACIASRRPILFVGPAASDVHLLAERSDVLYRRVDPGHAELFAQILDEWSEPSVPARPGRLKTADLPADNNL